MLLFAARGDEPGIHYHVFLSTEQYRKMKHPSTRNLQQKGCTNTHSHIHQHSFDLLCESLLISFASNACYYYIQYPFHSVHKRN